MTCSKCFYRQGYVFKIAYELHPDLVLPQKKALANSQGFLKFMLVHVIIVV